MSKWLGHAGGKATWATDMLQVLLLDRLNSRRRYAAMAASAACRTLKVHAHSRILPLTWPELFDKLGANETGTVVLPGPVTQSRSLGDVNYYYALGALVRALRPLTVLEIGTYLGVGTYCMAMNASPACRIITVDLPDEATAETKHQLNKTDEGHIAKSRQRVGEAFLGSSFEKQITQIRADSLRFKAAEFVSQADMVFVDGGHSLPCVAADTKNALEVIAPTGVILWDDYFHLYPDVVHFLDDLSHKISLFRITGTNLIVHSRAWPGSEQVA
ncbi:MAG TPA: class I SAM-dependent methyltransferase [Edaphobacter sp.]|nr:class I SAM-dependent methyltransferase [Edaphobacter sp.]